MLQGLVALGEARGQKRSTLATAWAASTGRQVSNQPIWAATAGTVVPFKEKTRGDRASKGGELYELPNWNRRPDDFHPHQPFHLTRPTSTRSRSQRRGPTAPAKYRETAENCAMLAQQAKHGAATIGYKRMETASLSLADEQDWLDGEVPRRSSTPIVMYRRIVGGAPPGKTDRLP
jgi:hypothetical protein